MLQESVNQLEWKSCLDWHMSQKPSVVVLGAGVIGLTTALRLCNELPTAKVTVFAEKFEDETTSAGAAGLWEPYKLSDTPPELIRRWGRETFEHLQVCKILTKAAAAQPE